MPSMSNMQSDSNELVANRCCCCICISEFVLECCGCCCGCRPAAMAPRVLLLKLTILLLLLWLLLPGRGVPLDWSADEGGVIRDRATPLLVTIGGLFPVDIGRYSGVGGGVSSWDGPPAPESFRWVAPLAFVPTAVIGLTLEVGGFDVGVVVVVIGLSEMLLLRSISSGTLLARLARIMQSCSARSRFTLSTANSCSVNRWIRALAASVSRSMYARSSCTNVLPLLAMLSSLLFSARSL
uniref:(northern house mosquito) hypothetical protein n=1 Tax=Culex pipiens TaxID=7175 RepID=A0A8D8FGB4_CULPI